MTEQSSYPSSDGVSAISKHPTAPDHPLVEIRGSVIHGWGGFARTDIATDTEVIEYLGERITKEVSNERCEENNYYIFNLDDTWDLDGNVDWNPARFLNHSCEPNCEAEQDDENRIWIRSLKPIQAGEELTFNYGYDLEDYREHICRCGKPSCLGYIVAVEFFEQLRRLK